MKYLEQYIEEKLKIKILGQLTTNECPEGEEVGVSLVIDGFEPGIYIWYADYAKWLEEKLDSKKPVCKKINKMTLKDFRESVLSAMKDKPKEWRNGQFVFNHIHKVYGVARNAQYIYGVDCFNDDSKIDEFIDKCYTLLIEFENYIKE